MTTEKAVKRGGYSEGEYVKNEYKGKNRQTYTFFAVRELHTNVTNRRPRKPSRSPEKNFALPRHCHVGSRAGLGSNL